MSGLAIIPARVGSQGIPRKNWTALAGETPVHRAIVCAERAGLSWVLSTDHPDAQQWYGAHSLYAPAPLHTETCSMVDVVLDVLKRVPGPPDQKVLLVQPTQPLRTPDHLRHALALLDIHASVASVVEAEPAAKLYFEGFWPVTGERKERRQDARPTYRCDGTVYGFRRGVFEMAKTFVAFGTHMLVIPPEETARLDTPFDWEMAERRLRDQRITPDNPGSNRSCPSGAAHGCARVGCRVPPEKQRTAPQALAEGPRGGDFFAPR
jgi:CMP-N-acetylneuraminic acid synthetase